MTDYPNPLIPGFNPDPSVVRVDGVYYLATSTFEYVPGIPIYRSTDFANWEHVANVATDISQIGVEEVITGGGVWAPTIRNHDGLFHLIVTIAMGRGCVVYTATDPAGEWSQGTLIEGIEGIDPDLAWDEDGTAIVTYSGLVTVGPDAGLHTGIRQSRVDLVAGRTLEAPRSLWAGSGFKFPEAPHLYRRSDWWYLMIAEGGTERGHGVSIARSASPYGPFDPNPANPFLSARSTNRPIQNTGHGDLVEAPDGSTAIVLLGVRPRGATQAFSALGRETFVSSIEWVDGWPVAEPVILRPREESLDYRIDFAEAAELDLGWMAVRRNPATVATITDGALAVVADGTTMDDHRPAFLGRRQLTQTAAFSTEIDTASGSGGLTVRYDELTHYDLEARATAEGVVVTARAAVPGIRQEWSAVLPAGAVTLHLDSEPTPISFSAEAMTSDFVVFRARSGDTEVTLARVDGRYLSAETAASFTGRVAGVYAVAGTPRFGWFAFAGSND